MMEVDEAQKLFYELYDQWKAYHDAARDLRSKVTQAFSDFPQISSGISPGVLLMLDSMEAAEKRLQDKMDCLIESIKK
jgi:hypothetical protein